MSGFRAHFVEEESPSVASCLPSAAAWRDLSFFSQHLADGGHDITEKWISVVGLPFLSFLVGAQTPNVFLICSSFSRENGHPLLI